MSFPGGSAGPSSAALAGIRVGGNVDTTSDGRETVSPRRTVEGDPAQLTDQALVAQLAHIEDVIGATPTFLPAAEGPELLNGALLDLLAEEASVLGELRIRLSSAGAASGVAHRSHTAWSSSMERMYVRSAGPATGET